VGSLSKEGFRQMDMSKLVEISHKSIKTAEFSLASPKGLIILLSPG
jgi:hypothetical protein